ncbi:hypothetical protein D3C81_1715250 [compost metagenome]
MSINIRYVSRNSVFKVVDKYIPSSLGNPSIKYDAEGGTPITPNLKLMKFILLSNFSLNIFPYNIKPNISTNRGIQIINNILFFKSSNPSFTYLLIN